jgi:hypothetical protein
MSCGKSSCLPAILWIMLAGGLTTVIGKTLLVPAP